MSPPPSLEHAQRLLDARDYRAARPLLETLLATDPRPALLYALCEAEINDGAAERVLARLANRRDDLESAFLHARAQAASGSHAEARDEFIALRARLPQPSPHLELHLAASLSRLGDAEGMLEALERAATLTVRDAALWLQVAQAAAALARPATALRALDAARAAGPRDAAAWKAIGQLYAELFAWRPAAEALGEAARRDPRDAYVAGLAALAHNELGESEAAQASLDRAAPLENASLEVAVARRLLLPLVYEDEADLERRRARFAGGLEELLAAEARWRPLAPQVFSLNRSNFLLAYQGGDDRPLQHGYSTFIARLTRAAAPELHEPIPRRFDGGRRLRVGFMSSFFRECTVGRYFERWITGLDGARFERFLYHGGALADDFTQRLAAHCDHFTLLRGGSLDAARRLKADALDVLVYPEVGMDPAGYVLATLRLAPVQLAAWGHPVTTGSDAIDGYITVDAMEPDDGAAHYVEPLLRLPGPGVGYALPEAPVARTREQLGFPADAHLYACPQSLFKIHPRMDALLARILADDPRALLVFFQGTGAAGTLRFGERLQRALAAAGVPPRGQVKFLPRMAPADFRAVLAASDVVVDTLHWSGGNTSFDSFAAGTPVVTLPGRFMRGRQTAAMLGLMGLPELVAQSGDDYVEIARRVATDRELNRSLRERIGRGREAIFERPEPVAALGRLLRPD